MKVIDTPRDVRVERWDYSLDELIHNGNLTTRGRIAVTTKANFKVYYTTIGGVPNQWRLVAARDELDAYMKAFPCQKEK